MENNKETNNFYDKIGFYYTYLTQGIFAILSGKRKLLRKFTLKSASIVQRKRLLPWPLVATGERPDWTRAGTICSFGAKAFSLFFARGASGSPLRDCCD